jgi:2-iminobutanoate/2-iminopropanoate deaminase
MQREVIRTDGAPKPIGPYSQAIKLGDLVFVAGQGPIDPATGQKAADVAGQTRQVMLNLKAILEAAGSSLAGVVKTTCFLRDMNDFPRFNAVYAEFFTSEPPARSTIQAARLPGDFDVEVEAIATVG